MDKAFVDKSHKKKQVTKKEVREEPKPILRTTTEDFSVVSYQKWIDTIK